MHRNAFARFDFAGDRGVAALRDRQLPSSGLEIDGAIERRRADHLAVYTGLRAIDVHSKVRDANFTNSLCEHRVDTFACRRTVFRPLQGLTRMRGACEVFMK